MNKKKMKMQGEFGAIPLDPNNYEPAFLNSFETANSDPLVRDESIDNYKFFAEQVTPIPKREVKPDKYNKGMIINSDPIWGEERF